MKRLLLLFSLFVCTILATAQEAKVDTIAKVDTTSKLDATVTIGGARR